MRGLLLLLAALAGSVSARPPGPRLERVVLVMRHGVRPPTKDPALAAGTASDGWPAWPAPLGELTPHGAAAVRLLARDDAARWRAAGLCPRTGCGVARIVADSDQRTIATAQAWAEAAAPGCAMTIEHRPQGEPDPLFSPVDQGSVPLDPAAARAAVLAAAGPGGIAEWQARLAPALRRLDAILCARPAPGCGVAHQPSGLAVVPGRRPKLTGALDAGSTGAQVLLLEWADGKPAADVGWGRATAADIARLSALHAAEFALLARPRLLARANFSGLLPIVTAALTGAGAAPVTLTSGHDTNVANLAGLLGVHWRVPGFAADDPAPGGALVLERWRDARGRRFVRALYRSQTLAQIRAPAPPGRPVVLSIPGCGPRLCPLDRVTALLTR